MVFHFHKLAAFHNKAACKLDEILNAGDVVDLTDKHIYTTPLENATISKVKKDKNGILIFECKSLPDGKNQMRKVDDIGTSGLVDVLDSIIADNCEPKWRTLFNNILN